MCSSKDSHGQTITKALETGRNEGAHSHRQPITKDLETFTSVYEEEIFRELTQVDDHEGSRDTAASPVIPLPRLLTQVDDHEGLGDLGKEIRSAPPPVLT